MSRASGELPAKHDLGVSQQFLWNSIHDKFASDTLRKNPSSFALSVAAELRGPSKILELGCGSGADAIFFGSLCHDVTATDFSDYVIDRNAAECPHESVEFLKADMRQPLPFSSHSFDVVYARLSLHYFAHDLSISIFREIQRVLRSGAVLHFMCKSTTDPLYGQGDRIEEDMYLLDGHVRHFFSKYYAKQLLTVTADFEVLKLLQRSQAVYGESSAIVVASARTAGVGSQMRLF